MRTLTFGDRTISYDAGLDSITPCKERSDERKVSCASSDSGLGCEGQEREEQREETDKRIIRPDDVAEEEDEYDEYNDSDCDADNKAVGPVSNQSAGHKKWRQAVIKDITSCSGRSLTRSDSLDGVTGPEACEEGRLSLKEVGHIRQVLARAELEADSSLSLRLVGEVERGEVCGACLRTRFSRLRGGAECSLCSQLTCRACLSDMSGVVNSQTTYQISDIPPSLLSPGSPRPSLPPHTENCAGSAPSSPRPHRQPEDSPPPPLLPPPVTSRSSLPGLSRRWSLVIWPRHQPADTDSICLLCRNIVKQILRTKGYNNRVAFKR